MHFHLQFKRVYKFAEYLLMYKNCTHFKKTYIYMEKLLNINKENENVTLWLTF